MQACQRCYVGSEIAEPSGGKGRHRTAKEERWKTHLLSGEKTPQTGPRWCSRELRRQHQLKLTEGTRQAPPSWKSKISKTTLTPVISRKPPLIFTFDFIAKAKG